VFEIQKVPSCGHKRFLCRSFALAANINISSQARSRIIMQLPISSLVYVILLSTPKTLISRI
jgi:hypothetical protein